MESYRGNNGTIYVVIDLLSGMMIFQQLSGVNALVSYATVIYKRIGFPLSWATSSLILGLTYVIATLLSKSLIDRVGRKLLLFLSMSTMSVCMFIISGYFRLQVSSFFLSRKTMQYR